MNVYLTKNDFFENYPKYDNDWYYELFKHFIICEININDDEEFENWCWNPFDFQAYKLMFPKELENKYHFFDFEDVNTFNDINKKYNRDAKIKEILL
jgi:hypothetical protein